MDRTESTALVVAGALMALFFAALVYAATALDIDVPTCVTDLEPFQQGRIIDKGDGRYEVHMVAKMWAFDPPEVRLPPGAEVDLYLSALDVTHGLYVEDTNVNLMAVPGSVNATRFRVGEEGEYALICHEYCGLAHDRMMGKLVVAAGAMPPQPAAAAVPPKKSAGATVFQERGCDACHTVDGADDIGPSMQGLFGRTVRFADGTTVVADEVYIEEAIRNPNARIVEGYDALMPEDTISDDELRDLVEYIKTL